MKKFNTFQELWSYCLFCPLCQDTTRYIVINNGFGESSIITNYKKNNEILKITCFKMVGNLQFTYLYNINCLKNTFTFNIKESMPENHPVKSKNSKFFFNLISNCDICDNTSINSVDIELDIFSKIVSNIGIEVESIIICNKKNKYHLVLNYEDQLTYISNINNLDQIQKFDLNQTKGIKNEVISFPLTKFDFSKPKKVFNRIKTLLVFS